MDNEIAKPNESTELGGRVDSVVMRGRWVDAIAKDIARQLFECGDNPGSPCTRIEFKGGRYSDGVENETAQGGLCETALQDFLAKAIDTHFSA